MTDFSLLQAAALPWHRPPGQVSRVRSVTTWLGAQIRPAADAPILRLPLHSVQGFGSGQAAAQIAGAELARARDALKAVNASAKESGAAAPEIIAARRDAQSKSSPAQLLAMLNVPAPRASR